MLPAVGGVFGTSTALGSGQRCRRIRLTLCISASSSMSARRAPYRASLKRRIACFDLVECSPSLTTIRGACYRAAHRADTQSRERRGSTLHCTVSLDTSRKTFHKEKNLPTMVQVTLSWNIRAQGNYRP